MAGRTEQEGRLAGEMRSWPGMFRKLRAEMVGDGKGVTTSSDCNPE